VASAKTPSLPRPRRCADSTVLSDGAFSIVVPILEQLFGCRSAGIRALFDAYGLMLHDREKVRTDRLIVLPPA
jgi:hypothetical protein